MLLRRSSWKGCMNSVLKKSEFAYFIIWHNSENYHKVSIMLVFLVSIY